MEEFESREVELASHEDGARRVFLMRPFAPGDEQGIAGCVAEEYGESYFKRDFYDIDKIREDATGPHYRFFVAETEGEIAGMEIFQIYRDDEEDYIEPASQIIHKRYRGYGLAGALVDCTLPLAERMRPCALFVHAVTFHKVTQIICGEYGMTPTGFRLGSFLTERMVNSYQKEACEKYSEGIMIKAVEKKDAGTIFLPAEIAAFADKIYRRLGVGYAIAPVPSAGQPAADGEEIPDEAEITVKTDAMQRIAIVRVIRDGRNLARKMRELIDSFAQETGWVIQLLLSISTPAVYRQYEELKEMGFFFAGLKPLCGVCERMYMQWIGGVSLHMEKYALTEAFDEIRRDIEHFMGED